MRSPDSIKRLAVRIPFSRFSHAASRLLWGNEQVAWRGLTVEVNPGEVHGYYVYLLNEYATPEIETLIGLCRGGRVFADVGANIGLVSLALASACPELRVVSFEPDAGVAERFRRNVRLNPGVASRIELNELAASDSNGTAQFVSSDAGNPETGHLSMSGQPSSGPTVQCGRLDDFFADRDQKPDVIKIDVEGAELKVLQGMPLLLERSRPKAIMIEVHGFAFGADAAAVKGEIAGILQRAGYTLRRRTQGKQWWGPIGEPASWPSRCHVLAELR